MRSLSAEVEVAVEGRAVRVHASQYDVVGVTGSKIPVILLDTNVEGNGDYDRTLAYFLYGGDDDYRLAQEMAAVANAAVMPGTISKSTPASQKTIATRRRTHAYP